MFIYKIKNKANGKIYIGLTERNTPFKRWYEHIHNLDKNIHPNRYLQKDWNTYGEKAFEFSIIKRFNNISIKKLGEYEKFYIQEYSKTHETYNIASGGTGEPSKKTKNQKLMNKWASNQVNAQKFEFEIEKVHSRYKIYWKYEGIYVFETKDKELAVKITNELRKKRRTIKGINYIIKRLKG